MQLANRKNTNAGNLNSSPMYERCKSCNTYHKSQSMSPLSCHLHYLCTTCIPASRNFDCPECQIIITESAQSNRRSQRLQVDSRSQKRIRNYPIQGMMVNYDKKWNLEGESEFASVKNCRGRTNGWIMCGLLAVVFFFSGIALIAKTSQKGTGVILAILGVIGVAVAIFFIFCKIRKVDKYFESADYIDQDNFIIIKRDTKDNKIQRRIISSDHDSERMRT